MDERGFATKLWDGLITMLAIWLAMTLAGCVRFLPLPSIIESLASLGAYFGLVLFYAAILGPGRRSEPPSFLVGALLYPAYFVGLLFALEAIGRPTSALDALSFLGAGSAFGFQLRGGPDTPIGAYLGPWLINAILPILLALAIRHSRREHAVDQSAL